MNGQESGGLPLPALGGTGNIELCFAGRMMGTEEGEAEMTSDGGQMLQGLMDHLGSHEMVLLLVVFDFFCLGLFLYLTCMFLLFFNCFVDV